MRYIVLLVLGLVLITGSFLINHKKPKVRKQITATIDDVIFSDAGNVRFYVSFEEDGQLKTGQTEYYADTGRKYNAGDSLKASYVVTKGGINRVYIEDPQVVPVSVSASKFRFVLLAVGILLSVVAGILLIHSMF